MTSDIGPGREDPPCATGPACPDARRAESERWSRQVLLQRHLHDGASLQISALVPQLGVLRDRMRDDTGAQTSIDGLQDQLHTVLQELREVARGIYPPLLDEAGLAPALREVADLVPVRVSVTASGDRFGTAVEGAIYFALTDCLGALPAGSSPVTVKVRRDGGELVVEVGGLPGAAATAMLDRVRPLGGRVTTREGAPIEMRVPCE
jgi:signal transduction histidine kinase